MVTNKLLQQMIDLTLAVLLLTGCGGAPTEPTLEATPIPPTTTPIPATATAVPTEMVKAQSSLQLSEAECRDLADTMSQTLGVAGEMVEAPFEDYISKRMGIGCQTTITGTGLDFENVVVVANAITEMLQMRGWQEDISYAGAGPGGILAGFRQANGLCLLVVSSGPSEGELCSKDERFVACWERLTPEQRVYTVTLNCAQDTTATAASQPEPKRIEFAPGAISAQVQGSLAASGSALHLGRIDRYVLTAMAGQEMTVNLSVVPTGDSVAVSAILVIWGADGTVLISDHADATTWVGVLPSTQDYYIEVKSLTRESINYTLEVIIPPVTNTAEEHGLPREVPPEFPIGEGLPPIHAYVYTAEPEEYELSLDFGADCQGAGACHHGSLTGKKVDSSEPVGTRNFAFEAERAQKVTLANGIEGYFMEALCGASCDDAKVFWIYNGFQYMVSVKGGRQSDLIDLANAAITNAEKGSVQRPSLNRWKHIFRAGAKRKQAHKHR